MNPIYSTLVTADAGLAAIASVLDKLPVGSTETLHKNGSHVRALKRGEHYREASPALARLGIDVDNWLAPPAGLFVVEERTVYIRSRSAMTIAHECGHALDACLGGGIYRSGIDPEFRRLFIAARSFVTPYAATGIDDRRILRRGVPLDGRTERSRLALAACDSRTPQIH